MRTKIQLKLNSDVLLTIIQMLEESVNCNIETIKDALLVSLSEDLIEKLNDKSKNIQKQVSILDHGKKHFISLKYHETYCLFNLLTNASESGLYDSNSHIKKVRRLINELQNKIDIKSNEVDHDIELDAIVENEESNTPVTIDDSSIETSLFDAIDTAQSNTAEHSNIELNQYDTFAYPLEDNWNTQLTDLVYALADIEEEPVLNDDSNTIENKHLDTLSEITTEESNLGVQENEEGINAIDTNDSLTFEFDTVDTTETSVEDNSIVAPLFDEVVNTIEETVISDSIPSIGSSLDEIIETIEKTIPFENLGELVGFDTPIETISTETNTLFEETTAVQETLALDSEVVATVEKETPKAKKEKKKKEHDNADQSQMSLF